MPSPDPLGPPGSGGAFVLPGRGPACSSLAGPVSPGDLDCTIVSHEALLKPVSVDSLGQSHILLLLMFLNI